MNDALVPDWIKELEETAASARAKSEAAAQRAITASLTMQAKGPEFWRQLLRELAINTDALPKIGIRGTSSAFSHPQYQGKEQHCRIQVALIGPFPSLTYTDLFYTPGDGEIRCHTLEGGVFELSFCITRDNGVEVSINDAGAHDLYSCNAEKAAERIVKRMVNIVRRAS